MKFQKKTVTIQQLAHGETLAIQAHVFAGKKEGPTIYLQANLHGPEVFGTALLLELIAVLKKKKDIKGRVIIVPCANPTAVSQVAYNSMVGRWNPQSGANWNRIFALVGLGDSIEAKLAAALGSLSAGADYVLDIHTTGSANAEHLFTYPWMHETFAPLGTPFHLELDPAEGVGAFDESHVNAIVATWEAHHHGDIDATVLKQRLTQLLNWLESVWQQKYTTKQKQNIYSKSAHLHAPVGGYYSWVKKVGDTVKAGETYAKVYQPMTGNILSAKAKYAFTLLGIYGIAATASGEQIGWIAY